ncbi:MAG: hypothetical protein EON59_00335 [Alphaproteobacteria bacterium]|nr:MAG: hypothetical protein EON59_00335 [Alphaproteobacteria bacterium]
MNDRERSLSLKGETMADRSYSPEEQAYADRLFVLVLNRVIGMEGDGNDVSGFVRPHLIRDVLAEVAATVDHNCQSAKTPRDRRQMGEEMGARYTKLLSGLDNDPAMRSWAPAYVVPERSAAN